MSDVIICQLNPPLPASNEEFFSYSAMNLLASQINLITVNIVIVINVYRCHDVSSVY